MHRRSDGEGTGDRQPPGMTVAAGTKPRRPTRDAGSSDLVGRDHVRTGLLWAGIALWVVMVVVAATVLPEAAFALLGIPLLVLAAVRSVGDATSVLTVYLAFLFLVPAHLVVPGVGASGRPPVLIGIAGLVWVLAAALVPSIRSPRGRQPLRIAMFLFGASFLLSYAAAYTRILPPIEQSALNRGLIVVAGSIGASVLAAEGITTQQRLEQLLRRLVWFAAVMALVGWVQFFTGFDLAALIKVPGLVQNIDASFLGEQRFYKRVAGTAMHPIEFGVVLAMVLPFALHFAAFDRHLKPFARFAPLVAIGAAVPMSVSRSGTLAAAIAVGMLVITWPSALRRRALVLGAGGLVLMRAAIPGLLGTIKSLFINISNDPSTTGRTDDYEQIAPYIADAPWFGRGFYTFLPDRYFTLDNQFLLTLTDSGVVGLLTLLGLFVVGASLARGARRRSQDLATKDLGQALAASVTATAVTFATFDAFSFPIVTALLFLLLGCAGALWRFAGGPLAEPESTADAAGGVLDKFRRTAVAARVRQRRTATNDLTNGPTRSAMIRE